MDLPGTNASNTRHAEVTRKVVEKEADVAIIMIPATQPLADSLVRFLKTTISSYLNRCIFVVSRMDQIRQKDHERMLNYIRNRLVDQLNISPDKLYDCSAQSVVDNFIGEKQAIKNSKLWIDKFYHMQVEIVKRLHSERTTIISEKIQNLFDKLFEEIKKFLQEQWNKYRDKEAQIQRETIQDLELFKNQQYRECIRMLDRATTRTESKINDHIDRYRDQTITTVKKAIFAASDWDELKNILNNKVATILQEQQSLLSKSIKRECRNLSQSAQEVGQHFDSKFMEVYQSLQALGGSVQHSSVFSSSSISVNAYSVTASARTLNSSNFGNAMAGLFSHIFRGLLDDRKQRIWGEVRPKLYDSFSEIEKQVQLTVKKDADNLKIAINNRIAAYITHYKSVVDAMLKQQKMELQRLTQLQATIQADLAEIERRRLQIKVNL
ncbi:dynamin family protein [Trichodesmium erythraeum 21-75]|nr:dynamin family protein [Trichodesmium erythraeum 21-75]